MPSISFSSSGPSAIHKTRYSLITKSEYASSLPERSFRIGVQTLQCRRQSFMRGVELPVSRRVVLSEQLPSRGVGVVQQQCDIDHAAVLVDIPRTARAIDSVAA